MSDEEQWRPVVGFEGLYEVSNHGRVRSLDREIQAVNRWGAVGPRILRGRMLRGNDQGSGYLSVHLAVDGERHPRLVHRLVAEAFCPAAEGAVYVNHKDGVKTNNTAGNLEWCTFSQNVRHAWATGLTDGFKMAVVGRCAVTGREVRFPSQAHAEEALSQSGRRTGAIHKGFLRGDAHVYGYIWEHV